jgi:hypothetical protein
MVNTLKVSKRNFWNGYFQAREIIDLGTTTTKVRGDVRDVNDMPLVNVAFTIFETGTNKVVAKVMTNKKGRYNAAKLPAVNFDFRWELEGYETVSESNVHIRAGRVRQKKVVMEKM